ncbi:hypothetical protein PG995_011254 [Apiospora arundinis]|uniref:Uncharacterized protein n=1 Tax=Apiospora arundinis TaxID=335852 RepID=A0ABR2IUX7_9PEZI
MATRTALADNGLERSGFTIPESHLTLLETQQKQQRPPMTAHIPARLQRSGTKTTRAPGCEHQPEFGFGFSSHLLR